MAKPPQPPSWHTITPRIVVPDPAQLVQFLKSVFDAEGEFQPARPSEMRIGDSILMVSDGGGVRDIAAAFLYVYVHDTDSTYARAIGAGAASIEAPSDMPYGDRRATVIDPWKNRWQIATYHRATNRRATYRRATHRR